ncbi:hypothetical protein FGO68_gene17664 [Halteria grandinella]|uniref:Uncharacterized protein n=1 Tax=Halteria grandinella TaxID=5974 RepID=A0A8J8P3M8_HALGN|nr:hypothetical protein FGO68_gene17664 [Halteria grandinella]
MKYCPVLLFIENKELQKEFGGDYMLQVYNNEGKCVFDKILHYDVASWNIFFDYFVFKLDDREEGGGWFYIIRFKDGMITQTRVKDIFNDSSCKFSNCHQSYSKAYWPLQQTSLPRQ